jgi:predicted amidohydrolase
MDTLNLHLWAWDAGAPAASPAAYAAMVTDRVLQSLREGAEVVVLPEFTWLGLERFVTAPDRLAGVARLFWDDLWPELRERLALPGTAVVLGTVPFVEADGRLLNRAPILSEERVLAQDKIHLTPWEAAFAGGGPLRVWSFRGRRLAVLVCLDVEVPELAAALRVAAVDLLLIPSATESMLGVERIGRCAAARAVELGCHVAVCPLVGRAESELVDENLGRCAVYSPAQSPLLELPRSREGPLHTTGCHRFTALLDLAAITAVRALSDETAPALLRPQPIQVEIEPVPAPPPPATSV